MIWGPLGWKSNDNMRHLKMDFQELQNLEGVVDAHEHIAGFGGC